MADKSKYRVPSNDWRHILQSKLCRQCLYMNAKGALGEVHSREAVANLSLAFTFIAK